MSFIKSKTGRVLVTLSVLLIFSVISAISTSAATFTVTDTSDRVDTNPGDGVCQTSVGSCSLRAAIQNANATTGADTIHLPPGTFPINIFPGSGDDSLSGDLDITAPLTIIGQGAGVTILDGNGLDRVLDIYETAGNVTLVNLTVQNGVSAENGGGIHNLSPGTLRLDGVTVTGNTTVMEGGGLFTSMGRLIITNGSILSNNSARSGGGLYNAGELSLVGIPSRVEISNSSISDNSADSGGGIYNTHEGTLTLTNVTLSGNTVTGYGGGLANSGRTSLTVVNATVTGNHAGGDGGGIFTASERPVSITESTFTLNTAGDPTTSDGGEGGALYTDGSGSVNVTHSTFSENSAVGEGGAITFASFGAVTFTDSEVSHNSAEVGGGINNSASTVNFARLEIHHNHAHLDGGGLINQGSGGFTLEDSDIYSNIAENGGGMSNDADGTVYVRATTFWDNRALIGASDDAGLGGGIYSLGDAGAVYENVTISGNLAQARGGALYIDADASVHVLNSTLAYNTAPGGSGVGDEGTNLNYPVYPSTSVIFQNTIVAGNVGGTDCNFALGSLGGNMDGGTSCGFIGPRDRHNALPLLDAVADNGGHVLTMAPRPDSLAIDGGVAPCPMTDARGVSRPENGLCDVGAFEYEGPFPPDDTVAPETFFIAGPLDDTEATSMFLFNGLDDVTAPEHLLFECRLLEFDPTEPPEPPDPTQPLPPELAFVSCSSPWVVPVIEEGMFSFEVRAIDRAGNDDDTPARHDFEVALDLTPPDTFFLETPTNPSGSNVVFTYGAVDDLTPERFLEFECRMDSSDPAAWLECDKLAVFSNLIPGQHTFQVRAADRGDNIDPTPATYTWTVGNPTTCDEANITLYAVEDSFVDQALPLNNFGIEVSLAVQSQAPGANIRTLLRFELPAGLPDCELESATLRLFGDGDPGHTLQAIPITTSWQQNQVTWQNQPNTSGTPALTGTGGGYREWNVTDHVLAFISGTPNFGWLIRDSVEEDALGGSQTFISREAITEPPTPPQLVLRFEDAGTPPPPPPPAPTPATVFCGQTIYESTLVMNDLLDCFGEGLIIGASNIILDLNGHTIKSGVPIELGEEDGLLAGIRNVGHDNVIIRNGTVQNFGYGVRLMAGATYNVIEDMTFISNVNAGVELFDADDGRHGNIVRDNLFRYNGYGLHIVSGSENSLFENNVFFGNQNLAIYLYDSSGHVIQNNNISGLTNNPLLDSDGGIELESSSDNQLINNYLSDTGDAGIALREGSHRNLIQGNTTTRASDAALTLSDADFNQVIDNVLHRSGGSAIGLGNAHHNLILNNDVRFNPGGIELGGESSHNRFEGNDASYSSAGGIGIEGGEGNEIINNVANSTNADGISIESANFDINGLPTGGSLIQGNTTNDNFGSGISVHGVDHTVTNNTAYNNAGFGISVDAENIDGGGNTASGNGEVVDCVGVVCTAGAGPQPTSADLTSPDTSILTHPVNGSSTLEPAEFTFTGSDNLAPATALRFECRIDAPPDPAPEPPEPGEPQQPPDVDNWTECSSPILFDFLLAGEHTFEVRSIDPGDNVDLTPASFTWTVVAAPPGPDAGLPTTTIFDTPSDPSYSTDATFGFRGSDNTTPGPHMTYECRLDSTNEADFTACTSPHTYTGLGLGTHAFDVRAVDLQGNADDSPATYTWTVEPPPPDFVNPETTITSGPDLMTTDPNATFTFIASEEATFECSLDGEPYTLCTSPVSYYGLDVGVHTFTVRAIDLAGNDDDSEASYTWEITPPPVPGAPACGEVITQSVILTQGLTDCLDNGLVIGADGITIDLNGFTIDGTGLGTGVLNDGFAFVTVRNGTVQEFDYGVLLNPGTANNIIETTTLALNQIAGITLLDADDGLAGNKVRDNEIVGNGAGVELFDSSYNTLSGNMIAGNMNYGLYMLASNNNHLETNYIVGSSDVSALLEGSSYNTLLSNTITDNPDGGLTLTTGSNYNRIEANFLAESGDAGVIVSVSVGNEIVGNTVREMSDSAIVLEDAQFTLVYGNDLRFNSGGIQLAGASENHIEANNASSTDGIGIEAGDFSEKNIILLNITNDNAAGGIAIEGSAPAGYGNFIDRNTANGNLGDGIAVQGVGHIVLGNQANNNAGWGIYSSGASAEGMNIDGGGNLAAGNAEPTQCYNISCAGGPPVGQDHTAPETLITAGPPSTTVFNSATIDFIGFDNATAVTFECRLDSTNEADFAPCTSPVTYSGLSLGTHTFEVRARDWSGNADPSPATHTWTVEALPPGTPPETTIVSGPDGATPSTSATFAFTANEPGVTFECSLNGATPTACTSPNTYTGLVPGAYEFQVYAIDAENLPDTTPAVYTWTVTPAPVPATVSCGQTLTQSTLVLNDLLDCLGDGLVIGADGITVDLNGHIIDGTGLGLGILNNGFDNVVVTNGTIQEFDYGVQLNAGSNGNVVAVLTLQNNQNGAVQLLGTENTTVRNNTITLNTLGIELSAGTTNALIQENTLIDNPGNAIYLLGVNGNRVEANLASGSSGAGVALEGASNNTIVGNTFVASSSGGVSLILASNNNHIEANTILESGSDAISLSESSNNTLVSNTAHNSGGSGIALEFANDNLLFGNDVRFNSGGIGLTTSTGNRIEANYASAAGGSGIELEALSLENEILLNTVIGNSGEGIYVADAAPTGQGNLIENNITSSNGGDGISVNGGGHTITNNTADLNGGWGIYASESGMDGGSNSALGNSEPEQCFNIVCEIGTWSGQPDTILVLVPDDPTNSSSALFTFTGVDDVNQPFELSFECRLDSTDPLAWVECENPWYYTNLTEGEHTVEVRAIDADANIDPTPATFTWLYTALPIGVAPDTFIDTAPPAMAPLFEGYFAFSSNEPDITYECSLDGAPFTACGFENPEFPVSTGVFEYQFEEFEVGPHTFAVRAIDLEGLVDPTPATYNWTITGIIVTVTSGPAYIAPSEPGEPAEGGETEETFATFTFNANVADVTYECSLDLGAYVPCTSPVSYTGLAIGEHILFVFATDADGNVQIEPTEYGWEVIPGLDTTPPNTFITGGPADPTGSVTFTFNGEDNITSAPALIFECSLDDPTDLGFSECTSPWTYPNLDFPEPLTVGPHTFYVRAMDAEDNIDPTPASLPFTFAGDAIAPTTTLLTGPPAITLLEEVLFSFSANDPFATFECSVDGVLFEACASPHTVQVDVNGVYELQVRATDLAGNVGAVSTQSWTFVGLPITTITASPTSPTSNPTAAFTFNADQPGATATFACALDAGPFQPCISPATYTDLANGDHTFQVQATNSFGLVEAEPVSYVWTVSGAPADTTPPDTTILTGPDPITLNTLATFTFSSNDPGAGFQCALNGGSFNECATPHEIEGLIIAVHTLEVRAVDFAGNIDATPATYTWEVDGAPLVDILTGPAEVTESTSASFTFVADDPTSTFECWLNGVISACISPVDLTGMPVGTHLFAVLATDAAGNVGTEWEEYGWTIMASAPPQTSISAGPATTTEDTTASFTFAGTDNATDPGSLTFECRLDSTNPVDFVPCASGQLYTGLGDGEHTFQVRATDEAGNTDPTPALYLWTVIAPNTLVGSDVTVNVSTPDNSASATLTYDTVSVAGVTSLVVDNAPPALPEGYLQIGAAFYDLNTTAIFSGPIVVCLNYTPGSLPEPVQLLHYEAGSWTDVTTINDPLNGEVCGEVTSLSPFAVAASAPPETTISSGPANPSTATTASFVFSADTGSTFQCSLDGAPFTACTSPVSYTGLALGAHEFQVRATDAEGLVDPTPASHIWTILPPVDCGPAVVFQVNMDAWVDQNSPTTNKGTDSVMKLQSKAPTDNNRILVRFNLPSNPPPGCQIQTATLRMFAPSAINGRTLEALRLTGNWTEYGVTWSNQPATSGAAATTTSGTGWREWDVAAQVQMMIETGQNYGFLIRDASEGGSGFEQQFHAREKNENVPVLVVTYVAGGSSGQDVIPPQTTIGSGPEIETMDTTAAFTFSADEPTTGFECSLNGAPFGECESPAAYSDLAVGEQTFAVRAVDLSGLVDPTPANYFWTVIPTPDTTPPQTTLDSGPAASTISLSASFTFSADEPGSTFECSLDGAAFTVCASPREVTELALGEHTFAVRATDQALNTDATPALHTWTVQAPPETTIASGPEATTIETAATFTFSADKPGSTFACSLDGSAFAACAAPVSYTDLSLGDHTFTVQATDPNGHADPTPATYSWTIQAPPDTTAPETSITSGPEAATQETTAQFIFSANEDATFACALDDGSLTACTSPVDLTELSVGAHTFVVVATDTAGNVDETPASYAWLIEERPAGDTTPPETMITSGPEATAIETSAAFDFSANEEATFACSLDGAPLAGCTSPVSFSGLALGEHTFTVVATDTAGNVDDTPATYTWLIVEPPDTTPPHTTIDSGPDNSSATTAAFTFSADEAGSTFECALDGASYSACASPVNYADLAVGEHSFTVRATDLAGNVDPMPATHLWTVEPPPDTTAPDTTIGSGPTNPTTNTSASFTFSANESGVTFECALDGSAFVACASPRAYSNLSAGSHTFAVRGTDPAGNVETSLATYTWTVAPPPNCGPQIVAAVTADAWIDQNSPSNNKGDDSNLKVQGKSSGNNMRTLVRFAMPANIPEGCVVESATLKLYAGSWKNNRTLQVYQLNGNWTEMGVTWNNKPATTGNPVTTPSGSGWRQWNVTAMVQNMVSTGVNHGFMIRDASESGGGAEQQFHSKEAGNNVPVLVITLAPATGASLPASNPVVIETGNGLEIGMVLPLMPFAVLPSQSGRRKSRLDI